MKRIALLIVLMLIISQLKAQTPLFLKGDQRVNVGVGIQSYPVVSLSVDYGIADDIADVGAVGFGPYIGMGLNSDFVFFSAGARGTFHYPVIDDLDTYVGMGMGFQYGMSPVIKNKLQLIPGFFIGANYPLNNNLVVFGEIGSGVSYLTAGVTLRLN